MSDVQLKLNGEGRGSFEIHDNKKRIAEMEISILGKELTAYHTEVSPEAEGKGLAKELLSSMVGYAREHEMKVVPLCPFVLAQFKRHPDEYADVWKK